MKKEDKKAKKNACVESIEWREKPEIITDPFGSYTGVDTEDKYAIPVQDSDDL